MQRCGAKPLLPAAAEHELSDWIISRYNYGCPVSKQEIIHAAWRLSTNYDNSKEFSIQGPSENWYRGFMKRHKHLVKRTPEILKRASACVGTAEIRSWFTSVENQLTKDGLLDALKDPRRVLNADETGFALDPQKGFVIAPRGANNVFMVSDNEKEQLTAMLTFSADGYIFKPFLIYPGVRLHSSITKPIETLKTRVNYTSTPSGWEITSSMLVYADKLNQEIEEQGIQKPVILFLDGHASHDNFQVSLKACFHFCSTVFAFMASNLDFWQKHIYMGALRQWRTYRGVACPPRFVHQSS